MLVKSRLPSRAFRQWIHENRDSHRVKDDDTTLMIVYVNPEN